MLFTIAQSGKQKKASVEKLKAAREDFAVEVKSPVLSKVSNWLLRRPSLEFSADYTIKTDHISVRGSIEGSTQSVRIATGNHCHADLIKSPDQVGAQVLNAISTASALRKKQSEFPDEKVFALDTSGELLTRQDTDPAHRYFQFVSPEKPNREPGEYLITGYSSECSFTPQQLGSLVHYMLNPEERVDEIQEDGFRTTTMFDDVVNHSLSVV